jgi:CelD/BcsL family acetyltransferase involved in cellulose biosynthesis
MGVEIVEGNPFPEKLLPLWESLLQKSPFQNPFLTPLWSQLWLRHFGRNLKVKTLLSRSPDGDPLALGVFSDSGKEGGKKGLTLLGSMDVWDYRDLILSAGKEEEALGALARFWGEGPWEELEFSGISEFSPTLRFLPALLRTCGFQVTQTVQEISVYLNLPPAWDDFLAHLDSKDRHELRRKMRRLERESSFEIREEQEENLAEKMDAFLDLHRKSRRDKAEFMTLEMEGYFREIALRFREKGWLSLPFLRAEGKDAAAYFSFRYQGVEYVYNSGYDPEYARLSPGIVLAADCIRRAMERGMTVFHFLRGQEDYKYRLGGKEEKICQIKAVKG